MKCSNCECETFTCAGCGVTVEPWETAESAPRPVIAQQAVADIVYSTIRDQAGPAAASLVGTDILGRLLKLARPMPTREQIARSIDPEAFDEAQREWISIVRAERRTKACAAADAVLALLNGSES